MRVVTISYTPLDAPGGVPRFNRDIHSAFPGCVHYSWWDVAQAMHVDPNTQNVTEWEKAKILGYWLLGTGRVTEKDVVIADSFWASNLEHLPYCISHQHGNWSHTTLEDVQKGIPPEFPLHTAAQLDFRRKYVKAGRKLTAVSAFIAREMVRQWNLHPYVISNGIDCEKFKPAEKKIDRKRPIVIHFTTTANKGFDHIDAVKQGVDADVWLLDEAEQKLGIPKYEALAQADLVVHPSAHEGNSYAVLETLACGVPIVGYNVGLLYSLESDDVGVILDREHRSPEITTLGTRTMLRAIKYRDVPGMVPKPDPRKVAEQHDIKVFRLVWQEYVNDLVSSR